MKLQQQLQEANSDCSAAEAAVIELVPLHLTVSQLRHRLAAEMCALTQLQVLFLVAVLYNEVQQPVSWFHRAERAL